LRVDSRAAELEQWFFRITQYADELLAGLETLTDWPEKVVVMQRNWIGRSEGARVTFPVSGSDARIEVFTTRIDTIYGATFVLLAPSTRWWTGSPTRVRIRRRSVITWRSSAPSIARPGATVRSTRRDSTRAAPR